MFKLFTWGNCSNKKKIQFKIVMKMIKKNFKKMEFIRLIENIQQIDVLTYLMLDETQKLLFKCVDKKQITMIHLLEPVMIIKFNKIYMKILKQTLLLNF